MPPNSGIHLLSFKKIILLLFDLGQAEKKCELGRAVDIDDEAEKRKEELYVPNWFTCDIKTGVSP